MFVALYPGSVGLSQKSLKTWNEYLEQDRISENNAGVKKISTKYSGLSYSLQNSFLKVLLRSNKKNPCYLLFIHYQ